MPRWLPGFGVPVLGLLLPVAAACDRTAIEFNATGPAPLNANVEMRTTFDLEPSALRTEAIPGACGAQAAVGVRLGVRIRGDEEVIVTGLRFWHLDPAGSRRFPEVIPVPSLSTTTYPFSAIPTSTTIPIPGMAPLAAATTISLRGGESLIGVLIRPGSHPPLDYVLHFGCGPFGDGLIVVIIETADREGRRGSTEVRSRVAS